MVRRPVGGMLAVAFAAAAALGLQLALPPDRAKVLWSTDFTPGDRWQQDAGVVAAGHVDARVRASGPGGRADALELTFGRNGSRWGMDVRSSFEALELERRDEVWFSYDVWFEDGFEFRGDGKLGGLAGGVPGLDPFDVSSGGEYDERSFSVRTVWTEDRGLAMYLYALHGAGKQISDRDNYGFAIVEPFRAADGATVGVLETGRWHRVEHHVRLNTPGRRDGSYELWLDGHRGVAIHDVEYRAAGRDDILIDQLFMSWFFGGGREDFPTRRSTAWTDDWVLSEALLGARTRRSTGAAAAADLRR